MLAKLLDAFTIPAGRLTEVEVGWALASTKLRSKHNRRQEINSLPRERVSPPFPTPYSPELQGANHTQARTHTQTLLHPLMQTHKCWHSRTLTQIHTCFSPPHSLCRGEAGRSPRSVPKQAPLCLLSPMKLLFFVVVNFPGRCVYLFPKLSPVTKSNLRHWNNQWRLFAVHGALRFLELK